LSILEKVNEANINNSKNISHHIENIVDMIIHPTKLLLALPLLFSCSPQENSHETKPTDTTALLSQIHITESQSDLSLENEIISGLPEKTDTIELTYYFSFNDCQRWILSSKYIKAFQKSLQMENYDPRGQIEFNTDSLAYYIENASEKLKLDERVFVNGNTIRFIGRNYLFKRLPDGDEFTVPNPPKGKVFRYYSYEILHPYKVWGPQVLDTSLNEKAPTVLTVK
jgi:hypothetical protein